MVRLDGRHGVVLTDALFVLLLQVLRTKSKHGDVLTYKKRSVISDEKNILERE